MSFVPPNGPPVRIMVSLPKGLPRELVSEYLASCQQDLPRLFAALAGREYASVRTIGHQMKGTGRPYGFPGLTQIATAIEQAAVHQDAAGLENHLSELEIYLSSVEIAAE